MDVFNLFYFLNFQSKLVKINIYFGDVFYFKLKNAIFEQTIAILMENV